MLILASKHCKKIAEAVSAGIKEVQSELVTTVDCAILCTSKHPLGREFDKLEKSAIGKNTYLIGAGFTVQEMEKAAENLQKKGANICKTLCLKRKSVLPYGGNVSEVELARAKAFGERIARKITGIKPLKNSKKNEISNYQQTF